MNVIHLNENYFDQRPGLSRLHLQGRCFCVRGSSTHVSQNMADHDNVTYRQFVFSYSYPGLNWNTDCVVAAQWIWSMSVKKKNPQQFHKSSFVWEVVVKTTRPSEPCVSSAWIKKFSDLHQPLHVETVIHSKSEEQDLRFSHSRDSDSPGFSSLTLDIIRKLPLFLVYPFWGETTKQTSSLTSKHFKAKAGLKTKKK